MSTVTPTNTPVERANGNWPKQPNGKNQPNMPGAAGFAAFLMAAEATEGNSPSDTGLTDLTDAGSPAADEPKDPGAAALVGLLDWQALSNPSMANAGPQTQRKPTERDSDQSTQPSAQVGSRKTTDDQGRLTPESRLPQLETAPAAAASAERTLPSFTAGPSAPPTEQLTASNPAAPGVFKQLADKQHTDSTPSRPGKTRTTSNPLAPANLAASAANEQPTSKPGAFHLMMEGQPPVRTTVSLASPTASEAAAEAPSGSPSAAEADVRGKVDTARLATPESTTPADFSPANEASSSATAAEVPQASTLFTSDMAAATLDELTGQIAYWASQGTQKASFSLKNDQDAPLEVSVAIRKGEVDVTFDAVSEEIREALQSAAEGLLKNMLESQGMSLGDVTFSAQGQASSQSNFTHQQFTGNEHAGMGRRQLPGNRSTSVTTDVSTSPVTKRPDIATSEKVDLFA
jgi:hypothetical protein